MRLIDANALMAEMHNIILEDGEDRRTFYEVIERQPTIEPPRMRGKWINEGIYGEGHSMCSIRCSNPLCNFHFIGYLDDYNYCPNCGSYNGGEE